MHYALGDGRTVSIPAATAVQRRDGLVAAQRVYIDLAPLTAAVSSAAEDPVAEAGRDRRPAP